MTLPKSKYKWVNSLMAFLANVPNARYVAVTVTAILTVGISEYHKSALRLEIAEYKTQAKEWEVKLQVALNEKTKLEIELANCRGEYNLIRSSMDELPIPAWIVNAETGMVSYINQAYVDVFLTPLGFSKFDIINTDASHIFGEELSRQFRANDQWVKDNKRPLTVSEKVLIGGGDYKHWTNTKYPVYRYGKLEGVGGVAYETFK